MSQSVDTLEHPSQPATARSDYLSGPEQSRRPRPAQAFRLGILGPLQVCVDGREVPLPQAKLRVLLATLAARDNKVVSIGTLIGELWGEQPPPTALRALRVYVSHLRKFFARHHVDEEHCRLVTQPPGYRLILAPGVLDRHRFERHCEQARALATDQPELASQHYRQALALTRGPALADVRAGSSALEGAALWLDEARLSVLTRCVDLDLRLGRHLEVVSELTALAADHPLNEGLHSRLMIALYRCGRTGDALGVYQSIRSHLIDELGTEPGLEIRRVQQAVLSADPHALDGSDRWTL